jgi:tetratricopeptide (TPR) repeat protein
VDAGRQAVAGSGGPADRARCLSTLASTLMGRFERLHARADLDESIEALRSAVDQLPQGNVDRIRHLTNLGVALQNRFQREEADDDLREAVQAARRALEETSEGSPATRIRRSNLAGALHLVFKRTRDADALNEAIDLLTETIEDTPQADPTLGLRRSNLGLALLQRFEHAGDPTDLRDAVEHTRDAFGPARATPPTIGPSEARSLINYGSALQAHGNHAGDEDSLDRAAAAWRSVASATAAITADRIVAAAAWGRLAARRQAWSEAADAYARGLSTLDVLAWRGVPRTDNEFVLEGWHDLARDTAACALAAGRPEDAVRLLDSGRGVLWARQLELRVDLLKLEQLDPVLAASLRRVRTDLDLA